jgi:SAM-dependent methyltransferase
MLNAVFSRDYIIKRELYRTIRIFAPEISGSVLDFGCGSKPYETLFCQATNYIGVDIEVTGHDHASSRIDVYYDGNRLPFADNEFDGVVSFEVFEHVFNLPVVLQEINRVTKNSGHLLISIPFAWMEHEQPFDFARYTTFGISHLLVEAGYDILAIRKTTTYLLGVFQLLIAYLAQVTPQTGILRHVRQVCLIFPFTLAAYALNALLPKRYECFCNCVVLAKKVR